MRRAFATRLVRDHQEWNPWPYQQRAVDHLLERDAAALFLDPGLGKTAIALEAFQRLKAKGEAKRMLVVAPLRVCQLVWRQEGRKWTQFRDLTFSLLHGPKKEKALDEQVDIHLINPEGVQWLTQQFFARTDLPWDIVVLDELTKFKNHRAKRSKKLKTKLKQIKRRWGLTGSPAPNGYMDLFGQMLILDDGASLGKFITYFRDQYFTKNWDGFSYDIRPGAAERIEARIAPLVLRMSAEDYLDLPPLVEHTIPVELPPAALKAYEEMKKEMLLALPEGVVTAANSAAVYSKLKQLTNGAVYLSENEGNRKTWVEVHEAKLDALEELIDELAGQPLLVAYEFQHDLARLRARLGDDTPTLSGLSGKRIAEVEAEWNRGELPVLLVHPASAGHGLNLQGAGASHICWFSKPWDLETYEQTIHRIHRQGSTSERIINHAFVVQDSIDEIVEEALRAKDTTQNRLLDSLNAEILQDEYSPTPQEAQHEEVEMAAKKLGFKNDTAEEKKIVPKGWGPPSEPEEEKDTDEQEQPELKRPKGWGPPSDDDEEQQREQVQSKIRAPEPTDEEEEEPPPAMRALEAFPDDVVKKLNGAEEKPKKKRGRPRKKKGEIPELAQTEKTDTQDTVPSEEGLQQEEAKAAYADGLKLGQQYAQRSTFSAHANPNTLATLFESIAKLLRGA